MKRDALIAKLAEAGIVVGNSHFVYAKGADGGDHGSAYVAKELVTLDPTLASLVGNEMAIMIYHHCHEIGIDDIDIVAPVAGAVVLGQWAAYHFIGLGMRARSFYADKADGGGFTIRPIYADKLAGRDVVVVEDILNSGGSAAETVKAVSAVDGKVILVCAMCNRGGVTAEMLGVPHLASIMDVSMEKFPEKSCPLCRDDVPIDTRLGHGKQFLANQAK